MSPSPAPPYSIVVVTWQCADSLRALIASMNRHLDGKEELVIVDNDSTDDPRAAAKTWKGPLQFVDSGGNLGFGAGSNLGTERAGGPAVVLLNPDTELVDGRLPALAAVALERSALVGPRMLNLDRSVQPSASGPEVGPWPWVRAVLPGAITPRPLLRWTEPYRLEQPTEVEWLTGSCIAGPTELLRWLGPFDPALHLYGEDIDLGLRAAAAGIPRWFDPRACAIVHRGAASSEIVHGSTDGWRPMGAVNWRAAIRRAHGRRREWFGWVAVRLNLRLRWIVKRTLGRASPRELTSLQAVVGARSVPELPRRAPTADQGRRQPPA